MDNGIEVSHWNCRIDTSGRIVLPQAIRTEKELRKWEPGFVAGMDRMRRLVCEFYDGFSFGRFVKRHPHLKGYVTDVLIGDLFKDDVDVLWPLMDEMRAENAATS